MPFIKSIPPFKARKATGAESPVPTETTTTTSDSPSPSTTSTISPLEVEQPNQVEGSKLRKRDRVRNALKNTAKKYRPVLRPIKKTILVVTAAIGGVVGAVGAIALNVLGLALLFAWGVIKFVFGALVVVICCPFYCVGMTL
ncbi:hypothetical protein BJX66DRAFT_316734, partial [Aspergillus keveii]